MLKVNIKATVTLYADPKLISFLQAIGIGYLGEKKDFKYYSSHYDNKKPESIYNLALCYFFGDNVEQNLGFAKSHFQKAALQNHVPSQFLYAYILSSMTALGSKKIANKHMSQALSANYVPAFITRALDFCIVNNFSKAEELFLKAKQFDAELNYSHIADFILIAIENSNLSPNVRKNNENQIMKYYRLSAAENSKHALFRIGKCYEHGVFGVEKNLAFAIENWEKAASLGDKASEELLQKYQQKKSASDDKTTEKKSSKFEEALLNKILEVQAQENTASDIKKALVPKQDINTCPKLISDITKHKSFLKNMGINYLAPVKSFKEYNECKKKNPNVLYNLALCYIFGDGVSKDLGKAAEYLKRNSQRKPHVPSLFLYGYLFIVNKDSYDMKKGANFVGLVARKYRYAPAMILLGMVSQIEEKLEDAQECFRMAMSENAAYAYAYLSQTYLLNNLVNYTKLTEAQKQSNTKQAVSLMERGASLNDGWALSILGDWYEAGLTVEKNLNKAIWCWSKAKLNGHEEVQEKLDQYSSHNYDVTTQVDFQDKTTKTIKIKLAPEKASTTDDKEIPKVISVSLIDDKPKENDLKECIAQLSTIEEKLIANYLLCKLKNVTPEITGYDNLSLAETSLFLENVFKQSTFKAEYNNLLRATKNQAKVFLSISKNLATKFLDEIKENIKSDGALRKKLSAHKIVAELEIEEKEKLTKQIEHAKTELQSSYQFNSEPILNLISEIESKPAYLRNELTKTFLTKVNSFDKITKDLKEINGLSLNANNDKPFFEKLTASQRWLASTKEKLEKLIFQLKKAAQSEEKAMKKVPFNNASVLPKVPTNNNSLVKKLTVQIPKVEEKPIPNHSEDALFNDVIPHIIMIMLPINLDSGKVETPRLKFIEELKRLLKIVASLASVNYSSNTIIWKNFIEKCAKVSNKLSNETTLKLGKLALNIEKMHVPYVTSDLKISQRFFSMNRTTIIDDIKTNNATLKMG